MSYHDSQAAARAASQPHAVPTAAAKQPLANGLAGGPGQHHDFRFDRFQIAGRVSELDSKTESNSTRSHLIVTETKHRYQQYLKVKNSKIKLTEQ